MAVGSKMSDLFPSRWAFVVFILYMALFINQGILVTASQSHGGYAYNTVLAVLVTEFLKLTVSAGTFIHRNSFSLFLHQISANSKVFFLYFIPAGLYCMYNNLAYTNLINFDPTSYFLLLQLRVVVTGIVFQVLFEKKLSGRQWASLGCLTLGCMVKEVNMDFLFSSEGDLAPEEAIAVPRPDEPNSARKGILSNPFGVLLILLQVVCSSGAGVYNEYLLKRRRGDSEEATVPVLVQNVCLYVDSIVCNVALLFLQGKAGEVLFDASALKTILGTPIIFAVVCNNAAIGIVTSFFLFSLNSILKTFASGLELLFTAILCWLIFGIPVHLNTFIAIAIVVTAIWIYSQNPVDNTTPVTSSKARSNEEGSPADKEKLLQEV